MATNHTANYQLNQWEATDQVLRTDFNADNSKIDAALAALNTTVQQHTTQIAQQGSAVAGKGNCLSYQIPYSGTGRGQVCSLTFPHKPIFVFVAGTNTTAFLLMSQGQPSAAGFNGNTFMSNSITWSENSVSWTCSSESHQCNLSAGTYLATALLDAGA